MLIRTFKKISILKRMSLKLVSILLIVSSGLALTRALASKRSMNCDTELDLLVGDEDKMLRNYIIRNDVQEEFKARNDNDEACMLFLKKVIVKMDDYKHDDEDQETKDMRKRDDELEFMRDERSIAKRRINSKFRRPFTFKY